MSAPRPRAADTAPLIPGDEAAGLAAQVLEWSGLGKQAGAQEALARGPLLELARTAYVNRGGEVTTWAAGPALVVWRESYSALAEPKAVPDLCQEVSLRIGRQPDWSAAAAIAGDRWFAIAAALGVTPEVRPAKGAIRQLVRAGNTDAARACLAVLAAPQVRRAS